MIEWVLIGGAILVALYFAFFKPSTGGTSGGVDMANKIGSLLSGKETSSQTEVAISERQSTEASGTTTSLPTTVKGDKPQKFQYNFGSILASTGVSGGSGRTQTVTSTTTPINSVGGRGGGATGVRLI